MQLLDLQSCERRLDAFPYPVHFPHLKAYPWQLCGFDSRHSPSGSQSSCRGDSGGPLFAKSHGTWVAVGVLSEGSGFCGEWLGVVAPNVFSRLSDSVSWVRGVTLSEILS
eukprot:TRINITY_DN11677_c0_g1_i1.p1 TRINITY_DN11677_c0_g1~~TRINITY_DN11677_c0_g1_i1.p1  ORF type:complete len:110 (-),score=0.70 TRINITY_DN11677_c0_g1_i1:235-564(-)